MILFAVGALVTVGVFFANLVVARREQTYRGSLPLVVYGAMTAAIIAVITLLHGAAIYIPTYLWSLGLMNVDPQVYRMIWWGLGHSSQQINVAAMVAIWYMLGALTIGSVVLNEKISRSAFVLYILFISMASAHHLLVDPGMGPAWKVVNTSYFMYMAVLASMIHGFTVPAGMELGMRLRGFTNGHVRLAAARAVGRPGVQLARLLGGRLRVRRRHHRRDDRHRADQHHRAQHAARAGPLPRDRGERHRDGVHGRDLLPDPADLPAQGRVLEAGEDPAVPVRRRHADLHHLDDVRREPSACRGGTGTSRFSQAPFDVQFNPIVDLVLAVVALGGLLAATGAFAVRRDRREVGVLRRAARHDHPRRRHGRACPADSRIRPCTRRTSTPGTPRCTTCRAASWDRRRARSCWCSCSSRPSSLYFFVNWKMLSFLWRIG